MEHEIFQNKIKQHKKETMTIMKWTQTACFLFITSLLTTRLHGVDSPPNPPHAQQRRGYLETKVSEIMPVSKANFLNNF